MAKRSSSSPKKSGAASSSSTATKKKLMGNKITDKIEVNGYPLAQLDTFTELTYYQNALIFIASTFVTIALLCQLRSLKPDLPSAKLDQSPSFKFYKKRVLLDSTGRIAALFMAISQPSALACLPTSDDPGDLDNWLISLIDTYQGNEKYIEKASTDNIMYYVCGQMSRLLGMFNSCPASNMSIFGISSSCVDWDVKDVLKAIPYADINNLDSALVIDNIKKDCAIAESATPGDPGTSYRPVFDESPFTGANSIDGGCKLENSIFSGGLMPIRSKGKSATLDSIGGLPENPLKQEDLDAFLSKIERKQYESAIKIGKREVLSSLNKRVMDRMKIAESSSDEGEDTDGDPKP
jgi:hypothetical protein